MHWSKFQELFRLQPVKLQKMVRHQVSAHRDGRHVLDDQAAHRRRAAGLDPRDPTRRQPLHFPVRKHHINIPTEAREILDQPFGLVGAGDERPDQVGSAQCHPADLGQAREQSRRQDESRLPHGTVHEPTGRTFA